MSEHNSNSTGNYTDISNFAKKAGIALPTRASAPLLALFGTSSEVAEDEGWWELNDVLWATRSMLSGSLPCRRYWENGHEVYRIDFFCLVEVHLEAVRSQEGPTGTVLSLRLAN